MIEQHHQDLGLCSFSFMHYLEKCFTQIKRALYGDAMLGASWRGTNMAAVKVTETSV